MSDEQPSEIEREAVVASQQSVEPTPNMTVDESNAPDPIVISAETADANDEEDVPAALERTTDDGPGFDDESQLPKEDFDGFAEDDVEVSE